MDQLSESSLRAFLDEKAYKYNTTAFIDSDPVSIPHHFSRKEDIEISAFLTATIAWGQRKTIMKNSELLLDLMDRAPFQFITSFKKRDLIPFQKFTHRTFNGEDCVFFLQAIQRVYANNLSLEALFSVKKTEQDQVLDRIVNARKLFFSAPHLIRHEKHFSDPSQGSAAKRINMFLRWMVRQDKAGVDFGIWKNIRPSDLMCPLDVHAGRVARKLGLLERKQDDWKAVTELTGKLRKMDPLDPVKYDYALFGLGVFEKF